VSHGGVMHGRKLRRCSFQAEAIAPSRKFEALVDGAVLCRWRRALRGLPGAQLAATVRATPGDLAAYASFEGRNASATRALIAPRSSSGRRRTSIANGQADPRQPALVVEVAVCDAHGHLLGAHACEAHAIEQRARALLARDAEGARGLEASVAAGVRARFSSGAPMSAPPRRLIGAAPSTSVVLASERPGCSDRSSHRVRRGQSDKSSHRLLGVHGQVKSREAQ
jgi:hypothetical protein